jgi:hypothetical protein
MKNLKIQLAWRKKREEPKVIPKCRARCTHVLSESPENTLGAGAVSKNVGGAYTVNTRRRKRETFHSTVNESDDDTHS